MHQNRRYFVQEKKKKHFPLEKEEKRDTKGRKRSLRDSFLEPTYSWAAEWRDQESFFRGGKNKKSARWVRGRGGINQRSDNKVAARLPLLSGDRPRFSSPPGVVGQDSVGGGSTPVTVPAPTLWS